MRDRYRHYVGCDYYLLKILAVADYPRFLNNGQPWLLESLGEK